MEKLLIFIAESNEGEQYLLKEAFEDFPEKRQICFFKNGCELIRGLTMERALPDLILMNLDMPELNGLETLYILKKIDLWQNIPVIMFSTSNIGTEEETCMRYGAKAFFPKPLDMMDYPKILKSLITEHT